MSMALVFTQILVILLYIAVGFAAGKFGIISPEQRKFLTGLCSNLILPFTILSGASQSVEGEQLLSLGAAVVMMLGLFLLVTAATLLFHKVRATQSGIRAVSAGLLTYPNCTFLGLPLCKALFGDIAVLYSAGAVVAFNVLFFTVQYSLFTGKKFNPKNLLTPSMLSTLALILMLVAGIHFPDPVQTVISNTGAMITPLSLIIIGVMLSESNLAAIVKEKGAYVITLLRNLLIPFVAVLLLRIFPVEQEAKLCVLVYIACPCAALTSIYAIKCDMEPEFSAHSVLLSTLFFAVSLPLILTLGQRLL